MSVRVLVLVLALGLVACGGPSSSGPARTEPASAEPTPSASDTSDASDTSHTSGAEASSTSASAGAASGPSADLADYARRTMAIVRRHWSVPAALGAPDTVVLESSIEIEIDPSTRLATGFHVLRESGNADFDASIRRGLVALIDAHETMPEPPAGLDDRSSVRLRLRSHP
ncbi:MAG: TonB C-terminal domain-containing protein [Sandaracinaceae bacterium]|nr:TonB C-terminal domain-containing protein [Sandaracinaceae bacterium]